MPEWVRNFGKNLWKDVISSKQFDSYNYRNLIYRLYLLKKKINRWWLILNTHNIRHPPILTRNDQQLKIHTMTVFSHCDGHCIDTVPLSSRVSSEGRYSGLGRIVPQHTLYKCNASCSPATKYCFLLSSSWCNGSSHSNRIPGPWPQLWALPSKIRCFSFWVTGGLDLNNEKILNRFFNN